MLLRARTAEQRLKAEKRARWDLSKAKVERCASRSVKVSKDAGGSVRRRMVTGRIERVDPLLKTRLYSYEAMAELKEQRYKGRRQRG